MLEESNDDFYNLMTPDEKKFINSSFANIEFSPKFPQELIPKVQIAYKILHGYMNKTFSNSAAAKSALDFMIEIRDRYRFMTDEMITAIDTLKEMLEES